MASIISYYSYDDEAFCECPACGWSGSMADTALGERDQAFDAACPSCRESIAVVPFPSREERERAASEGHPWARQPDHVPGYSSATS